LGVEVKDATTMTTGHWFIGKRLMISEGFEWSIKAADRDTAGDGVDPIRRPELPGKAETVLLFQLEEGLLRGHLVGWL
jgi:hypothetical protein